MKKFLLAAALLIGTQAVYAQAEAPVDVNLDTVLAGCKDGKCPRPEQPPRRGKKNRQQDAETSCSKQGEHEGVE